MNARTASQLCPTDAAFPSAAPALPGLARCSSRARSCDRKRVSLLDRALLDRADQAGSCVSMSPEYGSSENARPSARRRAVTHWSGSSYDGRPTQVTFVAQPRADHVPFPPDLRSCVGRTVADNENVMTKTFGSVAFVA